MNVSKEHKLVWIPFPESGERAIAEFLGKKGFFYYTGFSKDKELPISHHNYSTAGQISSEYKNFEVICSIDNPYRLIVNNFKKFSTTNWKLKSNTKELLSERINEWVRPIIYDDISLIDHQNTTLFVFFPYVEPENTVVHYIRTEKLDNDLSRLRFFGNRSIKLRKDLLPDISDSFKDVLSFENAKIIYNIHKTTFELLGYDPFSFTTRELTLKEKVDFIHN